ncbi:MAG: hypothetical protein ACT4QB_16060 [Gammaproteobacteria bacterium]
MTSIHHRGEDATRGDGVEGGGRLVGDDDRRPVRQTDECSLGGVVRVHLAA